MRALSRAGLRVLALGASRGAPALWSRHTAVRALGPSSAEPGFAERLAQLGTRYGPLVVHTGQEETVDRLAEAAAELPGDVIVPYPGPAPLRVLRDKRALAGLAEAVGLTAPRTLAEGPAGPIAAAPPPAPCVVKSTGLSPALPVARMVPDDASLRALLASLPPDEPIVVQERLDGALVGLAVVLDRDGRLVASFEQLARRLWPPAAGGSTVAVSVAPDPDLVDRSAALLRAAGYWGLAQMQFLPSPRGPALIDVNPRYYGSMPLATAAGVNLPAAWQAAALGVRLPSPPPAYRVGVSYRWLEGDLLATLKGSREHWRIPRARHRSGAMWASDDPVPSALMAAEAAWNPVRGRLRRLGSSSPPSTGGTTAAWGEDPI